MRLLNGNQPLFRHGGAGNRTTAARDYLTLRQARDLMAAAQYALAIGKPLTRHLTVRLERQGVSDADAVKVIGRLITLLRDHVRKTTGGEIAYIWSREHGVIIGGHVHILLHLPASCIWQGQRVQRWIERISGRKYKRGQSERPASDSLPGRTNKILDYIWQTLRRLSATSSRALARKLGRHSNLNA